MKWISAKDRLPPLEPILVWAACGMPHIAIYDYDEYIHTEGCMDSGNHLGGESIKFSHWMPLPEPPEKEG